MTDYSIFFIIAVVATGVGALLFLLSLFGLGEHDLDFDADSGADVPDYRHLHAFHYEP